MEPLDYLETWNSSLEGTIYLVIRGFRRNHETIVYNKSMDQKLRRDHILEPII